MHTSSPGTSRLIDTRRGRDASGAIRSKARDLLWRKSATFEGLDQGPARGQPYPSDAVLWLDDAATVTDVLRVTPEGGGSRAPQASVSVP